MITALIATLSLVQTPPITPPRAITPPAITPPAISVKPVRTMYQFKAVAYAAAPTGHMVAVSLEGNTVRIMDAATGMTRRELTGHPQPIYGLAYDRAGKRLATGDETGRIWIWDVATGKKLLEFDRLKAHARGIQNLSFNDDGTRLASTGKDDVVIIWNTATGKQVRQIPGKGVNVASATFDGSRLFVATLGAGLQIYETKAFALVTTLNGHAGMGVQDLAEANGGKLVFTGGKDNSVIAWDTTRKQAIAQMRGHEDWVMNVALSPNGRLAVSSANDRKVIVWNLVTKAKLLEIENQSAVGAPVVFTADGQYLLTASDMDCVQVHRVTPPQVAVTVAPVKPTKRPSTRRRH